MIVHTVRDTEGEPCATLFLPLWNGFERLSQISEIRQYDAYTTAKVIWDPFDMEELIAITYNLNQAENHQEIHFLKEEAWEAIFSDRFSGTEIEVDTPVLMIQGSLTRMMVMFIRVCELDLEESTSGDDDTYDYFPNATETMELMLKDLIELTGYESQRSKVIREAFVKVAKAHPNVEEWSDDPEHADNSNRIINTYSS